jgi:hypothetical protein
MTAPLDIVHTSPMSTEFDLTKRAIAALLDGRETVVHSHISHRAPGVAEDHALCRFYVLDWHDEEDPRWKGIRQVAVIAP